MPVAKSTDRLSCSARGTCRLWSSLRCHLAAAILAVPTSIGVWSSLRAQCTGVCGDVNSNGTIQSVDLLALFSYVSNADSSGLDMDCANVDDHAGVTLRDLLFLGAHLFSGWPIDCDINSGPFVPMNTPGYQLQYNSVYPAGDTAVTLYVDGTFAGETKAAGLVLQVRVDGEIPILVEAAPTAVASGSADWDAVAFNGPGTGDIPAGILMGAFWSADLGTSGPGRHPLGRAQLIMPPSAQSRIITVQLVELPVGGNQSVAFEAPNWNSDVWSFNLNPWIIDLSGDVNNDRVITSSDIISLVSYVFKGGHPPYPNGATGDVNCSGVVNSADIIALVNYVFKGGAAPCDVASDCTVTIYGWSCP